MLNCSSILTYFCGAKVYVFLMRCYYLLNKFFHNFSLKIIINLCLQSRQKRGILMACKSSKLLLFCFTGSTKKETTTASDDTESRLNREQYIA